MAHKRPARSGRLANARAIKDTPAKTRVWEDPARWAALICATLIAYAPALRGGMVWDDARHVTAPDLQSLHGLWRIWFELGATQQYYPLLHSAFWVEHRLWGDGVLGYHLTSVLLHALAACLVVTIVRRLSLPGAWLVGFVFALHPVCVEAVAWISEQKDTLSGVFCLAAALTYLNFDKTRRKSRYFLALGLFVMALMSKTVTATLPAALLVIFWWMRGRIEWRRDVLPLLPWFGIGAPAGLVTSWVERVYIGAQGTEFALTLPQRLLLAGRVPWFYAWKALWPVNLMFSYPRWKIDPGEWWQYLFPVGLAAVAAAFALLARKNRGPLAGFLIFVGTLFPVLGFLNVFPFRYSYVADHFEYLAILGIVVPAAAWLTKIARSRTVAAVVPVLLVTVLGIATWQQSGNYRDAETLYSETLARNPDSYFLHLDLGTLLIQTPGRVPDAIAEFEAAARLDPASEPAHMNLANALSAVPSRLTDAVAEYGTVLRMEPNSWEAHKDLGFVYSQMPGRQADAIAEYRKALEIDPHSAMVHFRMGDIFLATPGGLPDAVAEYQAALKIDPNFAQAHNDLGNALRTMPGRMPDAIAEFEAAVRSDPTMAEAHNNLGNALRQMPGRMPDAIAELQAAVRSKPDFASAHANLGLAYAQMPGREPDAIAEYRTTLRISPGSAVVHYDLAYVLAQTGQLPEAITECQEALRINPNYEQGRQLMAQLTAASRKGPGR
jgi:tetratricopeptide (TPR) repeat protein